MSRGRGEQGAGDPNDDPRSEADRDAAPSPVPDDRWAVAAGIAVLALGLGLVTQNRAVLVAAVVPVAFVAYGRLSATPTPDLSARRSFDPARPAVGERVTVTVTVRNLGRGLRDCRLADAVPGALGVVDGPAAAATTLRAGEEVSFTYTVRARRGDHEFGPVRAAAVGGGDAATVELAAESRLRCRATGAGDAASAPSTASGDAATDSRGGGVEFHAVREYQRTDPLSRVDWRRFARTGELATVEFREDRAATVALVVDTAASTFRRATPDAPTAVEYALFAAEGAFEALLERDANVSLAFHPDAPAALGPGTGVDHLTLGRRAFDAYGPGASRDPAEVPLALGAAGDPSRRDPADGDRAPAEHDDALTGGDGTVPPGQGGSRARSELRSDGGNDPFDDAFEPADGADGTGSETDDTGGPGTRGDGRWAHEERGDRDSAAEAPPDEATDAYDPGDAFDRDTEDGPGEPDPVTALRASLPSGARVLFCSPLLDDGAADLVRTLRADDHDVRVLSPALEAPAPAAQLSTFERGARVAALRGDGIGVVDWTDEPLREALARALREW